MCQAVIRAVRAVLDEARFGSRFSFDLYGWESERGRRAQKAYCFGPERHGFVVLGLDGRALACRPGHFYGEPEIREDLERILASASPASVTPPPDGPRSAAPRPTTAR